MACQAQTGSQLYRSASAIILCQMHVPGLVGKQECLWVTAMAQDNCSSMGKIEIGGSSYVTSESPETRGALLLTPAMPLNFTN